ncbi:MAG TPA: NmrA family NAD(P)-binding protein [Clostridia bacterium]|nr:NmrA family NAD(P)-binding protein [Clostridia bacterium]
MQVLVLGGTGTVGSKVVAGLAAEDLDVRVGTRSPERARNLPAGATAVMADLLKPETLSAAVQGVDAVFLLTALSQSEADEGTNVIRAMKQAGVRRVVFLGIHNVDKAPHIPHFKTKIDIRAEIERAGLSYTILAANNFYQNDFWYMDPITKHGVYPQPFGSVGLNRVDVRDIADAAVNVLTGSGHEGQTYPLVGPDVLTGETTAEIYSEAFGTPVHYGGDDLDAFAAQSKQFMPEWLVDDLRIMYDFFQKHGLRASAEDFAQQQKALGHALRKFQDFAAELASMAKASATGA